MAYTSCTPQKKGRFIAELRRTGVITDASRRSGLSRQTAYYLRNHEPDFAQQWDEAIAEYIEALEKEADRRARDGVVYKTYFDKDGNPLGEEIRYSDTLLMFRLKALKPEMYRDPPQGIDPKVVNLFLQQVLIHVDDATKQNLLSWIEGQLGVSVPGIARLTAVNGKG